MNDNALRDKFEDFIGQYGYDNVRYVMPDDGVPLPCTGDYQEDIVQFAWEAVTHIRRHDGHAEFVRAVRARALQISFADAIVEMCDFELATEQENG
jgi:hypothetical protein